MALQSGTLLIAVGEAITTGTGYHGAIVAKVGLTDGTLYYSTLDFLGTANGPAYYRDVSVRPNNPPIAVGAVLDNGKVRGMATRVLASGDYDPSWDFNNAFSTIGAGDKVELTRIIEQSDGKYLVAGEVTATGGGSSSLLVGRFTQAGSLDAGTFNLLTGYRTVDFALPGSYDSGARLALQAGQPILAGSVQVAAASTDYDYGVARLVNDLIYSGSFGTSALDD